MLIQGESGTGKELVARAIHQHSPRSDKPFVVINCSAYPSTLLESELFGHEKGAFTGASRRRAGRFEQAHGGTVFLDEIGEISQTAQIKLLRVLQSQKFERIGGEQTLAVDVRILAATNKNLLEQVKAGQFREDLFYRLNVIPIQLPPLRDRQNDIPLLARHFLRMFAERQKKDIREFSSEAMRIILNYRWPGNVRELENTIEHAVVLAKGKAVEAVDLPLLVTGPAAQAAAGSQQDHHRQRSPAPERGPRGVQLEQDRGRPAPGHQPQHALRENQKIPAQPADSALILPGFAGSSSRFTAEKHEPYAFVRSAVLTIRFSNTINYLK
ncbi:MAG: sigma-54 dependent transcriptional regulator [Desulfobacterales bacterium]|nr:sigma-54 dependent transcriptional regulator [Desulfobacterales bacterium]